MADIVINHNFVFVAEVSAKLKAVGYDEIPSFPGIPGQTIVSPSVGDLIDIPGVDRFMFVVVSKRWSFKPNGIDFTYVLDLFSDLSNSPDLRVVK